MNCSACGLPPLPNQQLKQCTRCKNAWYHDTVCQRQHYPQHKEECRLAAARETNNAVPSSSSVGATAAVTARTRDESESNDDDVHTSSEDDDDDVIQKIVYKHPLSKCQVLDSNRGRSLIAECNMYIGAHPLNPIHEDVSVDGWCEPLVPPVLTECERHSRCSYCFNLLDEQSIAARQSTQLLHHHCSRQCKDKDVNYAVEEHSIRMIHQIHPNLAHPPPTVLLASRILRYSIQSSTVSQKFNELCYNIDDLTQTEKNQYLQIMKQCHSLLRFTEGAEAACHHAQSMIHNPIEAYKFMSRLTMNGFTICTLEQMGVGIGVYPGASMINHSCRPNAVQSFYFFPSEFERNSFESNVPMLQITTCRKIKAGEEITISYCDATSPTHMRRKELWEGYKFICDCSWCKDYVGDEKVVGLKCRDDRCRGRIVRIEAEDSSMAMNCAEDPKYKCTSCGYARYAETLAELTQNVKNLEKAMKQEGYGQYVPFVEATGNHLKENYELFRIICNKKSSWYIAWCADAIVNWSIDALAYYDDERVRNHICMEALQAIDDSRSAMRACYKYPGGLKWYTIMSTEAKLRLLVANFRDDEAFIHNTCILWEARRYFSLLSPDHDEVNTSLDASIANYSNMIKFDDTDPLYLDHCHLPEEEVKALWIINGCQEYFTDPNKDNNFLYRHFE